MGMNFIYAPTKESFEDIFANIVMAGFDASKPVSDPMVQTPTLIPLTDS